MYVAIKTHAIYPKVCGPAMWHLGRDRYNFHVDALSLFSHISLKLRLNFATSCLCNAAIVPFKMIKDPTICVVRTKQPLGNVTATHTEAKSALRGPISAMVDFK